MPPNSLLGCGGSLKAWWGILVALAMTGCAKFPATSALTDSPRLAFRMEVASQIRTGLGAGEAGLPYIYIIALKLNTEENPTTDGPFPVVTSGGNGFVAGGCTHYIKWDPLDSPNFKIWKFRDATLNDRETIGTPVIVTPVVNGDKSISFEVDISQLVDAADVPTIQSVQVNFLTMTTDNPTATVREWDAQGNRAIPSQINSPVLVRLRSSQTLESSTNAVTEPTGDTTDPALDLSKWTIQVKLP